jgi:molecular chaperone DnaJ
VSKRDYYEVLGVPRTAADQQIKSAYRKLALQHHPDRNKGNKSAEEKFKEAAEAYAVLADAEKRDRYDRFGHAAVGGGAGAQGADSTIDFGDIFGGLGDIFGGARGRGGVSRGSDLRYDLKVSFVEAAGGRETTLKIPRAERCDKCSGSGAEPGTKPESCPRCRGQGQLHYQQGFLTVARTCGQCRGTGKMIAKPCASCRGSGQFDRERKITVKIPAGIATGQQLRLHGEGEHGQGGGPTGDLYVVIHVEDHPFFHREGDDLWCEVPVTYPTLVLGGKIRVPTLNGNESVNVPKGTQTGTRLRLRAKGIPHVSGRGHGDLLVTVKAEVPHKLSQEQQALVEQLDQTMPRRSFEPNSLAGDEEHPPFFERVRNIFG